jgi:hypothetical protein
MQGPCASANRARRVNARLFFPPHPVEHGKEMGNPRRKKYPAGGLKKVRRTTDDKIRTVMREVQELEILAKRKGETLKQFTEQDHPAFNQWIDEHLGDDRKALCQLLDDIDFHESVLDEAGFAFAMGHFCSLNAAIQAVRARMSKEPDDEPHPEEVPGRSPLEDMPEWMADELLDEFLMETRGLDASDLDSEEYENVRAEFFDSLQHLADGNPAAFEKALHRIGSDRSETNLSAVKVVFRRLVKRLHPDHNGDLDEPEKALWNEAMTAYQSNNAAALETIEVRLALLRQEDLLPGQIPALRRYRDGLTDEVEYLADELRTARQHPAWEFSAKKKTESYTQKMRREFRHEIERARARLKELSWIFTRAEKGTNRRKKKRKPASKKAKAKKSAATRKEPGTASPPPPWDPQLDFPF